MLALAWITGVSVGHIPVAEVCNVSLVSVTGVCVSQKCPSGAETPGNQALVRRSRKPLRGLRESLSQCHLHQGHPHGLCSTDTLPDPSCQPQVEAQKSGSPCPGHNLNSDQDSERQSFSSSYLPPNKQTKTKTSKLTRQTLLCPALALLPKTRVTTRTMACLCMAYSTLRNVSSVWSAVCWVTWA